LPTAMHLSSPIDPSALERAINEIIRRHEALRTTFGAVDGRPVQKIAPTLALCLPLVNLENLPDDERAAAITRLASEETRRPFDLAVGPLLRARLLRSSADEHVLLVTMHHIVSDEWSLGVFVRELGALYAAFSSGKPSPLPELAVQYADFGHWQREWLSGKVLEKRIDYWKQQLAGAETLELPTDHPRPAVQTFAGSVAQFEIGQHAAEQVKALGQRTGASQFMTLYAACAALLSRYSGRQDILVGSPIANRDRAETEPLIGFFVNVLPLRADLSGDPTFLQLLERVRQTTLD
ncbi:MAG: non-ribosomal peptide synthetase, partial [bacterium]|nr:non-ribosomal peptide synthetase [bacterium]